MESKLFENLYKDNAKDIYRYCYFRLKNAQDAEDIVSETFIEAFKNQFNDTSNIRPWLFKVARNTMYDKHFRRQNLETNIEDSVFDSIEIDTKSLEQIVLDEESIRVIKDELQKLDSSVAEVISLRVWNDLKFSEISIITGKNEDSVKKIFYRGLYKLKSNINSKPNYQIKSFTLPVILSGILAFGNSSYFNLSGNSLASIAGSITSNLNITNFFMNSANTVAASHTAATTLTGVSAKTATAGFFSTTAAKIIIGTVGTASIVGGGVGGAYVINEYNKSNDIEPVSYQVSSDEDQVDEKPTNQAATSNTGSKKSTYTNAELNISFEYSDKWKVINEIPANLKAKSFGTAGWEDSKMFMDGCDVILQNVSSSNTIIVINRSNQGEGGFCFSNGSFTNNSKRTTSSNEEVSVSKWQVADKYFDQASNSTITLSWKGDYTEFHASSNATGFMYYTSSENQAELQNQFDLIMSSVKIITPTAINNVELSTNFKLTANTSDGGTKEFPLALRFTVPEDAGIELLTNDNLYQSRKLSGLEFSLTVSYFLTSQFSAQYTSVENIGSNSDLGTIHRATYTNNGEDYTVYISNYQNSGCYKMGQSVSSPCGIPSVFNTSVFKGQLGLRCEGAVEECDKAVLSMKVN